MLAEPRDLSALDSVRPLRWQDDALDVLDQRRLPHETAWLRCTDADAVCAAIRALAVRGAPAIGIAAAYGAVLAARAGDFADSVARLRAARPTAVNLMWALDRMSARAACGADAEHLLEEARAIEAEDLAANHAMGHLGAALLEQGAGVLTHCNTGALATAGFGTALGVIRAGVAGGRIARVYAGETRPWLQGARLTAWELQQDGIAATLIADSAAAALMRTGAVQWVIVGADRVAANGDVANKIGTYALALAARHHGVRFMVVAPVSSVDMAARSGDAIEIELRDADEVLTCGGRRIAPMGVAAWNPVFDITPAALIDVLVTERGVLHKPDAAGMRRQFGAMHA
ncbi:MAG: S-methyl-5-thioribose-1-phosphate isomerase [Proteobacteria bacterium]|jgi:methylthioribose-1-phosphate isomerase|nr:S-methyl-5-thioribose-1-phosphate isomerase [Pseudomonadota bacterium]